METSSADIDQIDAHDLMVQRELAGGRCCRSHLSCEQDD
jgi:hypothetical protein